MLFVAAGEDGEALQAGGGGFLVAKLGESDPRRGEGDAQGRGSARAEQRRQGGSERAALFQVRLPYAHIRPLGPEAREEAGHGVLGMDGVVFGGLPQGLARLQVQPREDDLALRQAGDGGKQAAGGGDRPGGAGS